MEPWVAIDAETNRIGGFGTRSDAQMGANNHWKLSGNKCTIRKLKIGMILYDG